MCRKRILRGIAVILFGSGLILGSLLAGNCVTIVVGTGLIVFGLYLIRRT